MSFLESLADGGPILTEGSIVERIRRDPTFELDPDILQAAFVFDPPTARRLGAISREYLEIGMASGLPMVLHTPTWRANPERVARATERSCAEVNRAGVEFLRKIRDERGASPEQVFLAGLMACRGDAYDPGEALEADEAARFHEGQARALAEGGADFLLASTLPAASEARGMARAMGATRLPYILSFVLRPEGTLLDGTPLHEIVAAIDASTDPAPTGYWINCTHHGVFAAAMSRQVALRPGLAERVIGLQANTSDLPPDQLEGSDTLHGEDPTLFAEGMLAIHAQHGTRVLGGCCGSGAEHIRQLAERFVP
jgi:homocysteine S-methyltransferase